MTATHYPELNQPAPACDFIASFLTSTRWELRPAKADVPRLHGRGIQSAGDGYLVTPAALEKLRVKYCISTAIYFN